MEENFIHQEDQQVKVVAEGVTKGTILAGIGSDEIDKHMMLLNRQLQHEEVITKLMQPWAVK